MIQLFYTAIYDPIFNTLFYLYDVLPGEDFGVSIIILTIAIKIILFWPALSSLKAQKALQETQPKIEEIKKKYKDDKEELGKQLMNVYKENKVNPFSSCLPLLIQLPILLALYRVFFRGLQIDPETSFLATEQLDHLYGYLRSIYETKQIATSFLGFVDLAKTHNIILAAMAGLAQFFSTRFLSTKKPAIKTKGSKDEGMASMLNKQMLYVMPVITVVIGYQFPAGVTLYWLTTTLFTLGQQLYFFRLKDKWKKNKKNKNDIETTAIN